MQRPAIVVASSLGVVLLFAGCRGEAPCDAASCPSGCCDTAGVCQSGTTDTTCGVGGAACDSCTGGKRCTAQACMPGAGGDDGGTWNDAGVIADAGNSADGGGSSDAGGVVDGGSITDGGGTADGGTTGLPFTYVRPPSGTPLSAPELTAATDKYLDLLRKTNFFQFVDERVHGWPQSDPQGRYWYGVWWGGIGIHRTNGSVTFMHNGGAHNIGIPTSPILEGACFAFKQWPSPGRELLVRRLIRGMNSWILAMERQANDPVGTLLARSAYPESITSTDNGRTFFINYSAGRPGVDSYVDFVHLPANPHWGDLWIINKRSKDDVSHMIRAISTMGDCSPGFSGATETDNQAMRANYVKWSQRVEADGWVIATLDKSANLAFPPITSTMSRFFATGNAECDAMLSIRLLGHGNPGTFSCSNGIHPLEWAAMTNDHNGEIVRSFHEAAVRQALLNNQSTIAQTMLTGLAKRIEDGVTAAETNSLPVWLTRESLVDLILHSANTGVPLTWREVRWLHGQLDAAYTAYVTNTPSHLFRMFDSSTPDGEYSAEPATTGIHYRSLGLLVGTCAARYRNPATMPALDCSRVASWTP